MIWFVPNVNRVPRLTTLQVPVLDIHAMRRAGVLDEAVSTWRFREGEPLVTVRGSSEAVFVSIAGRPEQIVQLDYTPGTFGGTLCFFLCPECAQRRWHLYLRDRLACRECLGLVHQSRHTTRPAMLRVETLRKRLLDDRPIDGKRRARMIELLKAAEAKAYFEIAATAAAAERRSRSVRK